MKEPFLHGKEVFMEDELSALKELLEIPRQSQIKDPPNISISVREKEVLQWVELGKSTLEISLILGISPRTVNSYIYNIMEKLEAVNRPQMVAIALRKGLLQ